MRNKSVSPKKDMSKYVSTLATVHFKKGFSLGLPCISNLEKRYQERLLYPSQVFLLLKPRWMDLLKQRLIVATCTLLKSWTIWSQL